MKFFDIILNIKEDDTNNQINFILPDQGHLRIQILNMLSYIDHVSICLVSKKYMNIVTSYAYHCLFDKHPYLRNVDNLLGCANTGNINNDNQSEINVNDNVIERNSPFPNIVNIDSNSLDTLLLYVSYHINGVGEYKEFEIIDWAAQHGYLEILRVLFRGIHHNYNTSIINTNNQLQCDFHDKEVKLIKFLPTSYGINSAVGNRRFHVLYWLYKEVLPTFHVKFHKYLYPTIEGANLAAKKGHIDVLEILEQKWKLLPNMVGANSAAKKGHIDVLSWLAPLKPEIVDEDNNEDNNERNTQISYARRYGRKYGLHDIDIEKRGFHIPEIDNIIPILPGNNCISGVLNKCNLKVLQWLWDRGLISQIGQEDSVRDEDLIDDEGNIAQIIVISREDVNSICSLSDKLEILIWISEHIKIHQPSNVPGIANGLHNIPNNVNNVNFNVPNNLTYNFVPLLPNSQGANAAATYEEIDILNWLEKYNILPTNDVLEEPDIESSVLSLSWLYDRGYFESTVLTTIPSCNSNNSGSNNRDNSGGNSCNINNNSDNNSSNNGNNINNNDENLCNQTEQIEVFNSICNETVYVSKGSKLEKDYISKNRGTRVANLAVANYNSRYTPKVLTWLESKGFYPNIMGANGAAMTGCITILKELSLKNIYPDVSYIRHGINYAIRYNNFKYLFWLVTEGKDVLFPNTKYIVNGNDDCNYNDDKQDQSVKEVIKYDYLICSTDGVTPGLIPDMESLNLAARSGYLDILTLIAKQDNIDCDGNKISLLPNGFGMLSSALGGHVETVLWLESQGVNLMKIYIAHCIKYNQVEMFKLLLKRGIQPTQDEINIIYKEEQMEMIMILQQYKLYPDIETIIYCISQGLFNIILWLRDRMDCIPNINFDDYFIVLDSEFVPIKDVLKI